MELWCGRKTENLVGVIWVRTQGAQQCRSCGQTSFRGLGRLQGLLSPFRKLELVGCGLMGVAYLVILTFVRLARVWGISKLRSKQVTYVKEAGPVWVQTHAGWGVMARGQM